MSRRLTRRTCTDFDVIIERYLGQSGHGAALYDQPERNVPAMVEETTRIVRDREGRDITSTITVKLLPSADPVPPGSRITVHGRETVAISERIWKAGRHDAMREVRCE